LPDPEQSRTNFGIAQRAERYFSYPVNRIEEFLLFTPMCRSSSGAKLSQESAKKEKSAEIRSGQDELIGGSIPFKISSLIFMVAMCTSHVRWVRIVDPKH